MSPKRKPTLSWAAEQLTRATNALELRDRHGDTLLDRIHDAMAGHPKAARWDTSGTANRPWCWIHERDVTDCSREGLDCLAGDIVGVHDSTGDQAAELASRADRASTDLQAIDSITARICTDTEKLLDLLERWPAPRPATKFERSIALDNRQGCEHCATIRTADGRPLWGEPMVTGKGNLFRTDKDGLLPKPLILCQTCNSHVNMKGKLPPKRELENIAETKPRDCKCEAKRETWSAADPGAA